MPAATLEPGLTHTFTYPVPPERTVPHLYPEAPEFAPMPAVFATGYLVGLVEWACVQLLRPHLDWPTEQTVGTHIDLSHDAPTPPGLAVTVRVELTRVDGRRLTFNFTAHDDLDAIATGSHQRAIIDTQRFSARAASKAHHR
jgi:fluoroacetyl-CoA thioesterase